MTQPRTVLHVINTGGPGGAETVCLNLARHADRARWQPVVVVPDEGWITRALRDAGIETHVLGHAAHSDMPGYLLGLSRLISSRRVDLVHSHLFGPTYVSGLLGILRRRPVVGTIHGEGDVSPHERLRRAKFALVNRGVCRLVFVSEALRRRFLEYGLLRPELTAVVSNGVDVAAFASSEDRSFRHELGVSESDFLVGAVGNLRPAKGYDVLLEAAELLGERAPGIRFVIVGQGGDALEADLLTQRRRLKLDDRVIFAGFQSDVRRVMSSLDAFVLSSRSEGFSISTVEAMAAGLPVVATRCGGPQDIIEHELTGLLVQNESAEAIAGAIERLQADPSLRERFAVAARLAAADRFGVQTQARAYESIYDQCIAARAPAARRRPSVATTTP